MPQTGQVLTWDLPQGPGIRIDHGIRQGQVISPHYDPMLAKVITYGATRDEARRKLARAVKDTVLLGVNNNKAFLAKILHHKVFAEGGATTAFLTDHFDGDDTITATAPSLRVQALAAILMYARTGRNGAHQHEFLGWRNAAATPWHYTLQNEGKTHDLTLTVDTHAASMRCTARAGEAVEVIDILDIDATHFAYLVDGVRRRLRFAFQGDTLFLDGPFGNIAFLNATHLPVGGETVGSGRMMASMDGAILDVRVAVGDHVTKGQTLAVLEAMKMEHQLQADVDGVVAEVNVSAGQQVKIRQVLVIVTADDAQES